MKAKLYLLAIICLSVIYVSCEKTETFDSRWKDGNEAQFAKIVKNSEYMKLESASKNGFIMYKVISEGKTGIKPTFDKRVKAKYTGWYKNDWTKEDTYTNNDGNKIINKKIFASTEDRIPEEFEIRSRIDGFATAVQHMEVGDKWEIWIPWQLGYGVTGNKDLYIEPYTTLVFEIELLSIS